MIDRSFPRCSVPLRLLGLSVLAGLLLAAVLAFAGCGLQPASTSPPPGPALAFDIDGTLTPSPTDILHARPDAAAAVNAWAAKGYAILYLSARDQQLRSATQAWLDLQGFPRGDLVMAPTILVTDAATETYKVGALSSLAAQGYLVQYAYGDSSTDFGAYAAAGIQLEHVLALLRDGQDTCQPGSYAACLDSFGPHMAWIAAQPDAGLQLRTPTATATPPAQATPIATVAPGQATATARPTIAPTVSPTPANVQPFLAASGRAVVRFDLSHFIPAPMAADGTQLDTYAGGYLLQAPASAHPTTSAMELQIGGVGPALCLSAPCGPTALGLVVRWSSDIAYDGTPGLPESRMCGEGINKGRRLPIGPGPIVDVVVEWGPGFVRVTTPTGASWTAHQGAAAPGFGVFVAGLANPPKGIGWARAPWTLQDHGGSAQLMDWSGQPGPIGTCPGAAQ